MWRVPPPHSDLTVNLGEASPTPVALVSGIATAARHGVFLVHPSRKALAVIKQNIILSISLKVLALALAFFGWFTLWFAIVADMGATLIATVYSFRSLRIRP